MPQPARALCLAAALALAVATSAALAQVTFLDDVLTYQGQLKRDGQPYSGGLQVRLTVLDPTGLPSGPAVTIPTAATDGLFLVRLDIGSFETGLPVRRLRIEVKTPDDPDFVALSPDQFITRTPGAVVAEHSLATDAIAASSYPNFVLLAGQNERHSAPNFADPWQAFAPSAAGSLTHLVIPSLPLSGTSNVRLRIYSGSGVEGTILHEQRVGFASSGETVLALSRPVALVANTFYTWELLGNFIMPVSAADAIPGSSSASGRDFAFRAYSSPFPNLLLRGNRVGIGMGSPLATLHVFGREAFNTTRIESDHPAGTWLDLLNTGGRSWSLISAGPQNGEGAGELLFRDNTVGAVRMTLDTVGNLGLGTFDPDARFQITGGGNLSQGQTPFLRMGPASSSNMAFDTNEIQARNNAATAALFLNTLGGNVAIAGGGTAPQSRLHVFDGSDAGLTGAGYLALGRTAEPNLVLDDNEVQARDNGAASNLLLNASGGNIGIGGPAAAAKLHVQNGSDLSLTAGGYTILGSTGGNNLAIDDNEIQARFNGASSGLYINYEGGTVIIGDNLNSVVSSILLVGGNASKPGGGLWAALSDRRAKTDIKPLAGTLDRLLQLHGYSFRYTDQALAQGGALPGTQMGLVAQEVQQVFPDWVYTDDQGRLNVAERATTALMVEALRDLRAEKDAQIAERDAKIAELSARLERLEKAIGTDR